MSENAFALNQQFGIPGTAVITDGNGGLPCVRITTAQCTGEIYLLGGQVTRWKPSGYDEVLWLSREALFRVGKAIRGGIPVCFPWFGAKSDDPSAPSHGFVRNRPWELEAITAEGGAVTVSLLTGSDHSTEKFWAADFELRLRARFGTELSVELQLTNTGTHPAHFEEALHAYLSVGDVRQIAIKGLDATEYMDKTDGNRRKTQSGDIRISSETDRVYLATMHDIEIVDPVLRRSILVSKENSHTSVVWNPWIEKARSLSDFGDDEWPRMVCVERSNVAEEAISVSPGRQHTMRVRISVRRR